MRSTYFTPMSAGWTLLPGACLPPIELLKMGFWIISSKSAIASYADGMGKQIMDGQETFESLEQYILQQGDPAFESGRQEMLESILHSYL